MNLKKPFPKLKLPEKTTPGFDAYFLFPRLFIQETNKKPHQRMNIRFYITMSIPSFCVTISSQVLFLPSVADLACSSSAAEVHSEVSLRFSLSLSMQLSEALSGVAPLLRPEQTASPSASGPLFAYLVGQLNRSRPVLTEFL
jgi:hypothetical protein